MSKLIINGGRPLSGSITVSGSKNAALPILFACILTDGVSRIENLPDIGDVRAALKILCSFGAKIWQSDNATYVDCTELSYVTADPSLISSIRASTYLIGACLGRFGKCEILPYGGCNFSSRPIDMHLAACRALGAEISGNLITANRLVGGNVKFDKPSVGATVNAILLASSAVGETTVIGAAKEPHIDSLIEFLISCGINILRDGDMIHINGGRPHGGNIRIIGDMIEAGSYLAAGIISGGGVRVCGCPIRDMGSVLDAFSRLGAEIDLTDTAAEAKAIFSSSHLQITALPYPGFPTDLQPIFAPLMARLSGGEICDLVWRERFGYLDELSMFGVSSALYGNTATISTSYLHSASVFAPDLRGGMACVLAALRAEGKSEIHSAEKILRGYENIVNKLCALGADIIIEK